MQWCVMSLYLLQSIYNIDEISQEYTQMIAREEHDTIPSDSVHSTLEIVLTEMNYEEFRCEFVLRDYSICSKTTRVQQPCEIVFKCR